MIFTNHWVLVKQYCHFFMHLPALTQFLHSSVKARNLHGRLGMFFEAATVVFRSLDAVTDMITEPEMDILEQFKVIMYDQSNTTCKVDEAQLDLFALKRPSMNM